MVKLLVTELALSAVAALALSCECDGDVGRQFSGVKAKSIKHFAHHTLHKKTAKILNGAN